MTNEKDAGLPRLPEVDDARIDAVERRVFSGIARERTTRRHRRRVWTVVGAVAAVAVVAIAIVPTVGLIGLGSASSGGANIVAPQPAKPGALPNNGAADAISGGSGSTGSSGSSGSSGASGSSGSGTTSQRAVVTTATATLRVDDVRTSAAKIGAAAKAQGGYVQSMNIGQTGVTPLPATGGVPSPANGDAVPAPGGTTDGAVPPASGAWITVRIPADRLDDLVASLAGLGQVEASTIDRQDVTDQSIDLQARIAASEASVARLTELMGKAGSVADLLAAESALADRQATLESEQQQLKALDDQVAMSTLTVTLLPRAAAAPANPAGFGSGLVAGWNSLVAALNGVVVVIGFLLPWLAVAAVIALIVWAILALRRRRRAHASMPPAE